MNDDMDAQEQSFGGMLENGGPQESKPLTSTGKCIESEPKCDIEGASHDGNPVVSEVKLENTDGTNDGSLSSVEVLLEVTWIGEALKVVDEKTYYESCSIDGIIYKTQDYALVGSNSCELHPSIIQVLWEDNKTRTKWAMLTRCYFPNDMPLSNQPPSTPEKDERISCTYTNQIMRALCCSGYSVVHARFFLIMITMENVKKGSRTQAANCHQFICASGSMMNQRMYLRPLLISRKLPQDVEGFKRE